MKIRRLFVLLLTLLIAFHLLTSTITSQFPASSKVNPYKRLDDDQFLKSQLGSYGSLIVFRQNGQLFVNQHPSQSPDFYYKIYDHTSPKDNGEFRIIFLGNSQVYQVTNGDRIPVPFKVEDILRQKVPGKKIKVLNLSCFGMGVSEFLITAIKSISDLKPDMIILAITPRDLFNEQPKAMGIAAEYSLPILDPAVSKNLLKQHFLLLQTRQYNLFLESFVQYYKVWQRDANRKLNSLVAQAWPVYESRTDVAEKITEALSSFLGISNGAKKIKEKEVRTPLAEKPYYEDGAFPNTRSFQYEMLINFLSEEVPGNVVIYNEPLRPKTTNLYFYPATFAKRVDFLKKVAENNGIEFADFHDKLPDSEFQDWIHLEPQGVEALSKMIVEKIINRERGLNLNEF
jgi:hypothetical protein